jgi:hypothetical protein
MSDISSKFDRVSSEFDRPMGIKYDTRDHDWVRLGKVYDNMVRTLAKMKNVTSKLHFHGLFGEAAIFDTAERAMKAIKDQLDLQEQLVARIEALKAHPQIWTCSMSDSDPVGTAARLLQICNDKIDRLLDLDHPLKAVLGLQKAFKIFDNAFAGVDFNDNEPWFNVIGELPETAAPPPAASKCSLLYSTRHLIDF